MSTVNKRRPHKNGKYIKVVKVNKSRQVKRRGKNRRLPRNKDKLKVQFAPASIGNAYTHREAQVSMSGSNIMRVRHTEFISDLLATNSTAFSVISVPINPGIQTTFPWLSGLASRFEKYRFRRLSFEFVTRASTNQPGVVIMMMDYDCLDLPPASKQIMLGSNATVNSLWQNMEYDCEFKNLHDVITDRYIRGSSLIPSSDLKTYDLGNFLIGQEGVNLSTGTVIGEIMVTYEVDLITPQLLGSSSAAGGASIKSNGLGMDGNHLFGNAPVTIANANTIASIIPTNSFGATGFSFSQLGNYLVDMSVQGTGLPQGTVTNGPGAQWTFKDNVQNSLVTATCTENLINGILQVTGPPSPDGHISFTEPGSISVTGGQLRIAPSIITAIQLVGEESYYSQHPELDNRNNKSSNDHEIVDVTDDDIHSFEEYMKRRNSISGLRHKYI